MQSYKEFVGNKLKGRTVRFYCDCLVKLDVRGLVVDFEVNNNEIIYIIDTGKRIIRIGENTPKLHIEL